MTKFIQPIGPIRPISPERLTEITSEDIVTTILRLACIFLFYLAMHKITKLIVSKTPGFQKESKNIPIYHCISIILVSSLLIVFGWSIELFKGVIFMLTLLYATVSDNQTHKVDDFVSLLIFITGFIGASVTDIPMMLFSGFAIGLIFFICACLCKDRLGAADIKFAASCAFLLGFEKSIPSLIIGLLLAIICNLILSHRAKIKWKDYPFALIPYLSIGFMAMYFI